jgi:hypothetical protein
MSKRIFLALILAVLNTAHAQIVKGFTASTLSKAELTTTEKFWLSPMGPLARGRGVTGSYGPLGTLGPFGDNFWNATFVMNMMGNWQDFAETLTQLYGPLSQQGPLFLTSELAQHWASFAFPTSVRALLVPGGVLHAVGNAGPLGPLGIAGPLGPHGAHGFDRNLRGDYLNKSKRVVKSITLELNDKKERFELYELYASDKLTPSEILDTSFATRGELSQLGSTSFKIKATRTEWINLLVVNEYELDRFTLKVTDELGKSYLSDSVNLSAFVNVLVKAGTVLSVEVKHAGSAHFLAKKPYRLFVTGSRGMPAVVRDFQF